MGKWRTFVLIPDAAAKAGEPANGTAPALVLMRNKTAGSRRNEAVFGPAVGKILKPEAAAGS